MVDQDDIYLDVKINYNNNQMTLKQKDLPSSDEIKNFIMKNLDIPNTKDYLTLSYKDDKGSNQKIEDGENFFNYAQKKENNHKEEYILELDLKVDDKINKFKQFFKGEIDENKYNQYQNELEKLIKENKIIKKENEKKEKTVKSKDEELENLEKKINKLIMALKRKEKIANKELEIELHKKELENEKLKKHINIISEKMNLYNKIINKFFEDRNQIIKVKANPINEDILKNQGNVIKTKLDKIENIYNSKSGKKELNEKNIQFSESTTQKGTKNPQKNKSDKNDIKNDSSLNNSILSIENNRNLNSVKINKDNNEDDTNIPHDSKRDKNKNNIEKNNSNNIIKEEKFKNDEFSNFLNEIFIVKNNEKLNIKDKEKFTNYLIVLKQLKENPSKKFDTFLSENIFPILENAKKNNIEFIKNLQSKKKDLENILKNFEKKYNDNTLNERINYEQHKNNNYNAYLSSNSNQIYVMPNNATNTSINNKYSNIYLSRDNDQKKTKFNNTTITSINNKYQINNKNSRYPSKDNYNNNNNIKANLKENNNYNYYKNYGQNNIDFRPNNNYNYYYEYNYKFNK